MSDLKKTLQREFKVQALPNDDPATAAAAPPSADMNEFDDGIDDDELASFDLDAASKQDAAKKVSSSSSNNVTVEQQQKLQKEIVEKTVNCGTASPQTAP